MIGLDGKVKGKQSTGSYKPLPEGTYNVTVDKIEPWKELKRDINVNQRDADGEFIRDEHNKIVKKLERDYVFYTSKVTYKVLDGEYKDRLIFGDLTTHPNASFITENFLFGVDVEEISYGEIPNTCVGKNLILDVEIDTYEKKTTVKDQVTGIETEKVETVPKNIIKGYKKMPRIEGV